MLINRLNQVIDVCQHMEHVAEWLRQRTRDLGAGVRFHLVLVMCRSLWQALNPHCLWPPSSNGYLVKRKLIQWGCHTSTEYALHSSQDDETVKQWVPVPGKVNCEVLYILHSKYTDYKHLSFTFLSFFPLVTNPDQQRLGEDQQFW
jgi:hypothetical protein